MHLKLRRLFVTFASVMMLVLSVAPASFAGGDGCDDDACGQSGGGGGGGDTGSAVGGAQTGLGGTVATSDGPLVASFALASGSVVLLTLAGAAGLRSRRSEL
jgi:hypothetical protein